MGQSVISLLRAMERHTPTRLSTYNSALCRLSRDAVRVKSGGGGGAVNWRTCRFSLGRGLLEINSTRLWCKLAQRGHILQTQPLPTRDCFWTAVHGATIANGTLRVIPTMLYEELPHERDPQSDHHIRCFPDESKAIPVEIPAGTWEHEVEGCSPLPPLSKQYQ